MPPSVGRRVDIDPLVRLMLGYGLAPKQVFPETLRTAYYRAVRAGFTSHEMADRLAVAIKLHPIEVWGEAWLTEDRATAAFESLKARERAQGARQGP